MTDCIDKDELKGLASMFGGDNPNCIRCGLCLPSCPTYRETGLEGASPRGRISLMRAMSNGDLDTGEITSQLDLCLGCRACEAACPSGIRYGSLLEGGRAGINAGRRRSLIEKTGRYLIFEWLLPSRKHLDLSAGVLRLYQMAGLQGSVRRSAIIKALWPELYNMNQLLPQVPSRAERRPPRSEFRAVSQYRGRIALFIGCVMQAFYPQMNRSAAELLAATGCEVMVPLEQCCCGAVHLHSGEERKTMALARKNIESFENTGASMLVVDSAGCGALLKEYGLLLKDDPRYASRAEDFAGKVVDIAEYLDRSTLNGNLGRLNMNVVYDEPCHLIHVQGISEEPKALLKSIPGLTLMPLEEADKCYSGAGIYNITQWEFSMRLLDRKMNLIKKARPDAIVTANPGCLIQLGYGARRWKLEIPVLHTVELLRMAYNV